MLTIFAKCSLLDVWQRSEYASVFNQCENTISKLSIKILERCYNSLLFSVTAVHFEQVCVHHVCKLQPLKNVLSNSCFKRNAIVKKCFPLRISSVNVTKSFPAYLITFTKEILNGKLHFLCSTRSWYFAYFQSVKVKNKDTKRCH